MVNTETIAVNQSWILGRKKKLPSTRNPSALGCMEMAGWDGGKEWVHTEMLGGRDQGARAQAKAAAAWSTG